MGATKKRTSCCCVADPVDKYLNAPTINLSQVGGGVAAVPISNIGGCLQPWEFCGGGSTGGCGVQVPRTNCGQLYDPAHPNVNAVPCGFLGGPGNLTGVNVFTLNPDYKPQKKCQYPGWKAVLAKGVWPGTYGFINSRNCCTPPAPPAPTKKYTGYERRLFMTFAKQGSGAMNGDGWIWNGTSSAGYDIYYSSSVDRFGNQSGTTYESSFTKLDQTSQPDREYSTGTIHFDLRDDCGLDGVSGYADFQDLLGQFDFTEPFGLFAIPTVTCSCGILTISWGSIYSTYSGTPDQINALNLGAKDLTEVDNLVPETGYTLARKEKYTGFVNPLRFTLKDDQIIVESSADYTMVGTEVVVGGDPYYSAQIAVQYKFRLEINLTGDSPYSNAIGSAEDIAKVWNLGDDDQYPWRQDGETWLVPMVTLDAASTDPMNPWPVPPCKPAFSAPLVFTTASDGVISITSVGSREKVQRDYSNIIYTGKIIGAPQAVGNARYFNFSQSVQQFCENRGTGGGCGYCQNGYGQLSFSPLPKTATQWTDATLGNYCPTTGGALIQAAGYDGVPMVYKWAETLESWPSANLARPFGRDRFVVDYRLVPASDSHNTPCAGGTAGISAGAYTPGDSEVCTDPTSFLYAYRRWPACRAIGSTIGIASAVQTSAGVVTLTTTVTHWLLAGDALDFYNVPGLGGNLAVTTATPGTTTFTVAGTLAGAYAGTPPGYTACAGMTQDVAQWDWTCPRHQFIAQTWQTTYRANGGAAYSETQGTLLPNGSKPSVLLISPNNEAFPAGTPIYRIPFGTITYEDCFTPSEWHGAFIQAVPDPFWKPPVQCSASLWSNLLKMQPLPCTDGAADGSVYYKFHPLVEPMLALPPGAPAFVAGVTFCAYTPTCFGDGTTMPGHAGSAGITIGGCQDNQDTTQLATIYAQYIACVDWKASTHEHCTVPIQYPLPLASGFIQPGGSGQLPAPDGGGAAPGTDGGGLGL